MCNAPTVDDLGPGDQVPEPSGAGVEITSSPRSELVDVAEVPVVADAVAGDDDVTGLAGHGGARPMPRAAMSRVGRLSLRAVCATAAGVVISIVPCSMNGSRTGAHPSGADSAALPAQSKHAECAAGVSEKRCRITRRGPPSNAGSRARSIDRIVPCPEIAMQAPPNEELVRVSASPTPRPTASSTMRAGSVYLIRVQLQVECVIGAEDRDGRYRDTPTATRGAREAVRAPP